MRKRCEANAPQVFTRKRSLGAMPPFGNLYGMPVFADASLEQDKEIAFNAGTHRELIRMSWEDFKKLVEPEIIRFAAVRSFEAA